ncbi:8829_t:CDS:2, partial [Cetraspora pellucida]
KNSAHRKKIDFPNTKYDDLYKLCLEIMLKNCDYVGAIIPASFINAELFQERLHSYTLLSSQMFTDTENPVCLVLFSPEKSNSIYLYENDKYIGELYSLKRQVEQFLINNKSQSTTITFNNKQGNLGLRAIDGTRFPTIAFIEAKQVPKRKIKVSSRHLTRIYVSQEVNLSLLNEKLKELREITNDFFLTPFRGLRKDGKFRRQIKEQIKENLRECEKKLDSKEYRTKIEKWCRKFGFDFEEVFKKAKSDYLFRAFFAKDPKKQNIYEKALANYLNSLEFITNFKKLSSGGKNARYIDRGVVRKGEMIKFYAYHKYIEESGGAQDNQFKEIKNCIEVGRNGSQEVNRRIVFICDGAYFTDKKIKELKNLKGSWNFIVLRGGRIGKIS